MKKPSIFRLSSSAFGVVGFGIFLFLAGYRVGAIDDAALKKRQEVLHSVYIPFAMTGVVGLLSWSINKEIDGRTEGEIEKERESYEKKRGQYKAMYFESLRQVKEVIEPIKLSDDIYQKCLREIERCERLLNDFENKKEAADSIYLWLSSSENRKQLKVYAVSQVMQFYEIPEHKAKLFHRDIGRCINWLRDSISRLHGYDVLKDQLAESYKDLPFGLDAHLAALSAIKSNNVLRELSKNSGVLEDFVDEISERLKATSS
ncbi:MAG: hypothetical protein AAF609_14085 [Cyanobacteria bacterium P01_C01_bin.120]